MDKFKQLIADLDSGELGYINIQNAMRQNIRNDKNIPDSIKSLLAGTSSANSGIIAKHFSQLNYLMGNLELAYRRGKTDAEPG